MSILDSDTTLSALTVRQPWAGLIARGEKRFETRSWAPPKLLVGQRLAIHAGQARLPRDLSATQIRAIESGLGLPFARWDELPFGAIVCTAILDGAYRVGGSSRLPQRLAVSETLAGSNMMDAIELEPAEEHFGDFHTGRWLWALREIKLCDRPVRTRGQRRVWKWHLAQ